MQYFFQVFLSYFVAYKKWLPRLTKENIKLDIIAGIIGALIVLPQAVAFATIAGLPPQYGLYAAMIPAAIAAFFGSSWHLVSGPTTAISLVVFGSISVLATPLSPEFVSLVLTLTFLVGFLQLGMSIFGMGSLVNFISHTVAIGFTAGAAILIASSQLKNFFGLSIPSGSHFLETWIYFFSHLSTINYYVALVAIVTLLSGLFIKKKFPKIPYMIPAMLLGSLLGFFLNTSIGGDITGIKTVGAIPASLPPLSLPNFSPSVLLSLIPAALAVTLLALTESLSIARAIAIQSGQKIDGNQEFFGQGMSNLIGSFFSAYPAAGSFNRSGVNYEAGAATPFSSIIAAIALAVIVLLVAPLAAYLPLAVMAGILFLVAYGLIDQKHIYHILESNIEETIILVATFLSTLFLELEFAIFVGVILSLFLYLKKTSNPHIQEATVVETEQGRKFIKYTGVEKRCPQLQFFSLKEEIYFGAIATLEDQLTPIPEAYNTRILCCKGVPFVDLAGGEFLVQQVKKHKKKGVKLLFCSFSEDIMQFLTKGHFVEAIGEDHFFASKKDALKYAIEQFDKGICASCATRIFHECPKGTM